MSSSPNQNFNLDTSRTYDNGDLDFPIEVLFKIFKESEWEPNLRNLTSDIWNIYSEDPNAKTVKVVIDTMDKLQDYFDNSSYLSHINLQIVELTFVPRSGISYSPDGGFGVTSAEIFGDDDDGDLIDDYDTEILSSTLSTQPIRIPHSSIRFPSSGLASGSGLASANQSISLTKDIVRKIMRSPITKLAIELPKSKIDKETAISFGDYLQDNSGLKSLNINIKDFHPSGFRSIMRALISPNQILKALVIRTVYLDDKEVNALGIALQYNKTLKYLDLSHNDLGHMSILRKYIVHNQTLKYLNLNSTDHLLESPDVISDFLRVNRSLVTLDIADNHIKLKGIIKIAEALKDNVTLKNLSLERIDNTSSFGVEGLAVLGEMLQVNDTLEKLNISNISPKDIPIDFLNSLKYNTGLKFLRLDFNNLGERGGLILDEVIEVNKNLRFLSIFSTQIPFWIRDKIETTAKGNPNLEILLYEFENRPDQNWHEYELYI